MNRETVVDEVAQLSFAQGKVGQRYPLLTPEDKADFAHECAENTVALTKANTAFCGDERFLISLADGTTDPNELGAIITPQLFGGLGLATTKAAVAANLLVIRDAKNIWDAYLKISDLLAAMGEEDAGHFGCGASLTVESSVALELPEDTLLVVGGLFVPDVAGDTQPLETRSKLMAKNAAARRARLEDGFYGAWDVTKHLEYLQDRFPQNLATLLVDQEDHETNGHNGSGLYVVTGDGVGYRRTGRAFSVTQPKMLWLAEKLGTSDEERQRLKLAFADDTARVGASIVTENFPVFAQAA